MAQKDIKLSFCYVLSRMSTLSSGNNDNVIKNKDISKRVDKEGVLHEIDMTSPKPIKCQVFRNGELMNLDKSDAGFGYPSNMSLQDIVREERQRERKEEYYPSRDHQQLMEETYIHFHRALGGELAKVRESWQKHQLKLASEQGYRVADVEAFEAGKLNPLFDYRQRLQDFIQEFDDGLSRYEQIAKQKQKQQQKQKQRQ